MTPVFQHTYAKKVQKFIIILENSSMLMGIMLRVVVSCKYDLFFSLTLGQKVFFIGMETKFI